MSYKLSQAAEAADLPVATVASWIDRQLIPLPRTGSGNHRALTLKDVDRIVLVAELVRLGLPVSDAAHAIRAFCDLPSAADRPRGALFVDGDAKTLLIVDGEGSSLVKAHDREAFEDAMSKLFADTRTAIVLNISETLKRVDAALEGQGTRKVPAAAIYRHGRQMAIS